MTKDQMNGFILEYEEKMFTVLTSLRALAYLFLMIYHGGQVHQIMAKMNYAVLQILIPCGMTMFVIWIGIRFVNLKYE